MSERSGEQPYCCFFCFLSDFSGSRPERDTSPSCVRVPEEPFLRLAEVEEVDCCTEVAGGVVTGEPEGDEVTASGFFGVLTDVAGPDGVTLRSDVLPFPVLVAERSFEPLPPIYETHYDVALAPTSGLHAGRVLNTSGGANRFYTRNGGIRTSSVADRTTHALIRCHSVFPTFNSFHELFKMGTGGLDLIEHRRSTGTYSGAPWFTTSNKYHEACSPYLLLQVENSNSFIM